MFIEFREYLKNNNMSANTIKSYLCSVNLFNERYKKWTKNNLLQYKNFLIENYKPKTVNLRILGINKYLDFVNKPELKLKEVKTQQKTFLENVISLEDYEYFKKCLFRDKNYMWYFVVWFLAATGARVSELIEFKMEHIETGSVDVYSKGGKIRRIYIPQNLQKEYLNYALSNKINSGFIFKNKYGDRITTQGIANQLKVYSRKYKLNVNVVHPHSFRHLFAKTFLSKCNDISLLADLLGHDSIETTRIYLRKTSTEQQQIVNDIVTW